MKFTVTLDIEVDMDGWCMEYGTDNSGTKADVLSYVTTQVTGSYAGEEELLSVEAARISQKRETAS